MDEVEMRSVIKYLHMKGKTPLQIFNEMKDTYAENGLSVFVIQYWVRKFKFGFSSVRDEVRPGRPADAVTDYYISKIKDLVFEDRRITINHSSSDHTFSRNSWYNPPRPSEDDQSVCKVGSPGFDLGDEGRKETMFHRVLGTF
jgi:hypothetical protein